MERIAIVVLRQLEGATVEAEAPAGDPVGVAAHGDAEIVGLGFVFGGGVEAERHFRGTPFRSGATSDCRVAP
jgi:hypothetical protein